ncbi:MAG: hypothetical protein ACXVLQ_15700 [Bacteriovorax sp.]
MKKTLCAILTVFFCAQTALADTAKPTRWIDLEWDEVQGAKGYDIELFEVIDNKEYSRGSFHTESPHWSKETKPGNYNVKIRALDSRKVPGAWGEPIPVVIKLVPPTLLRPLQNEILPSSETDDLPVTFQWSHVPGALFYQFIVFDSNNKVVLNEIVKDIEVKRKISRIDNYKWYVLPMFSAEEKKAPQNFLSSTDENFPSKNFVIKGQMLKAPVIDVEIVRNRGFIFRWNEVFRADHYSFDVLKEEENKELKKILSAKNSKRQLAIGKDKLSDGRYIINIKALARDYQDSPNARVIFKKEKDNFEVINNESLSKDSMNRPLEASSIEGQFGYPTFNYSSKHYETDTFNQETLRGIRLQGKWRKNISDNRYQNLFKFEIAQVADSNTATTFFAFSENIGRAFVFKDSRFYLAGGLRFDSTPLVYADRFDNKISSQNYKSIGPELNVQYNYRWSPIWSSELKTCFFSPVMGISSPDGSKLKPSMSYDAELKLLYTINGQFDFYTGFNHTDHSLKSTAITGGSSFALQGDVNEIKFTATYLIFGAEFFY